MIERWKLRREFNRIARQILGVRNRMVGAALAIWWQRARAKHLKPLGGKLPSTEKIALFLVYQPGGCPESVFKTLAHLSASGYAPFVVCNGGVKPADRTRLLEMAWQLVERPNLGYDFGGYRDGIWLMKQHRIDVDRLLVINDTLWFPAVNPIGTVSQLEATGAEYTALCNFVYRPRSGRHDGLVRKTYAASFCFLLGRRALTSDAFQEFWERMPLYAAKSLVVERGEVGFSRAMTNAGFAPAILYDHVEIEKRISAMSPEALEEFLRRLPVLNGRVKGEYYSFIEKLDQERVQADQTRAFLLRLLYELNPWDILIYYGLVSGLTDFVKKANLKDPSNAKRFLALAEMDGLALEPTAHQEIAGFAGVVRAESPASTWMR